MEQTTEIRRHSLEQIMEGYWNVVKKRGKPIPTDFRHLDEALGGGLYPGRLYALLGEPGGGKTALANILAYNFAAAGHPVLYLTLEETEHDLANKTISRLQDVDYTDLRKHPENYQQTVADALVTFQESDIHRNLAYIDDGGSITIFTVKDEAMAHFGDRKGLIVVDYLQVWARMQRTSDSARYDLREAVAFQGKALRNLAVELNCSVLALVSMNRASYSHGDKTSEEKVMSAAKESGDVEYDADVLMAILRDGKVDENVPPNYEGRTLFIAKNRLGESHKSISLAWRGARQEFVGLVSSSSFDSTSTITPFKTRTRRKGTMEVTETPETSRVAS